MQRHWNRSGVTRIPSAAMRPRRFVMIPGIFTPGLPTGIWSAFRRPMRSRTRATRRKQLSGGGTTAAAIIVPVSIPETPSDAAGRSGTVYCLNKTTGATLQKFSLPAEQGIISTGQSCHGHRADLVCNGQRISVAYRWRRTERWIPERLRRIRPEERSTESAGGL